MPQLNQVVTIRNTLGLHARAATKLAQLAHQFDAQIFIRQGDKQVDAGSVMGLMLLASQKGKDIEVIASGTQAQEALDAIVQLVEHKFDEDS